MNGPAEHMLANAKPAMPRFHTIGWSFLHGRADFDIENLETLLSVTPESRGALIPPPGRRGFPTYPEKPRVVIGKRKKGPPPSDIEMFGDYWLVSDRLKVLFEALDGSAFAFQSCDILTSSGSAGPTYWLCDVVRVLEAIERSGKNGNRLEKILPDGAVSPVDPLEMARARKLVGARHGNGNGNGHGNGNGNGHIDTR